MKKEKHSGDKISEQTLHEILLDIKYRLDHIEDMEADNRAFIVKLIKQGNSIVRFLAQIDLESVDNGFEGMELPSVTEDKSFDSEKFESLRALIHEFMEKKMDLKDFEKELKKHRDMLTPGQMGEA